MLRSWRDRRVFITGASGFLGSQLTSRLINEGADVCALVLPSDTREAILSHAVRRVQGVVEDVELLKKIITSEQPDTVFHLAAQSLVGDAVTHPLGTFETNIRGTYNVLEACRCAPHGISRIIVSSSDKVYGEQERMPTGEESSLQAAFPYDVSKACADIIARSYAHTFGLPVCVTRCANIYGEGDLHWSRLVPSCVRSVLRGEHPVLRGDGTATRDYVYIRDVIDAHLHLADAMNDTALHGEAFNITSGEEHTAFNVALSICKQAGRADLSPVLEKRVLCEIAHQHLSGDAFQKATGWQAATPFVDGLKNTIEWYRQFFPSLPLELERTANRNQTAFARLS